MNAEIVLQYIPILELLFFNLLSIYRCCERKYSVAKTCLALFLFSAAMFSFALTFFGTARFKGDGGMFWGGFIYLIPFRLLYKGRLSLLFTTTCTCCVYTMGILSLSIQVTRLLMPDSQIFLIAIETLGFLLTFYPFYKHVLPKYIFATENIAVFRKGWIKYMLLNNCLTSLTLIAMNGIFVDSAASISKVFALLLLLSSIYVSYFILYKIILDSLRMDRLEHEALHDPLTGLGNRSHLWNHLHRLIEEDITFSVLFMDLDKFKQINDHYGHIVGDEYLKHFSQVVSDILKDRGKVYRFGGDEFIAVYHGIVPPSVVTELKECREWEKGAPCPFNHVSTGTLICEPPHKDVEQILQQVDRLMYESKLRRHAGTTQNSGQP